VPVAALQGALLHFEVLNPIRPAGSDLNVVLVHGLGTNLRFWYWKLAPALAAFHRVVIFDLRGHGLSSMPRTGYTAGVMATDLEALLDFLGVADAHFLGHSFGGRVVVHFACKNPKRVNSIVLADVRLKSVQPKVTGSLFGAVPARGTVGFVKDEDEPAIAFLEALACFRLKAGGLSRTARAPKAGPFSGVAGGRNAIRWLRLLNLTTARDDIARSGDPTAEQLVHLSKPTLLVYGEYSHAMPTAAALVNLWPHARIDVVSRANHFFPIAYPERFVSTVTNFFAAQYPSDVRSYIQDEICVGSIAKRQTF
jgi:pimeloyl-ACP methyl ester carboxylesterase